MKEQYAPLRDGRIFYTSEGSGTPVILLHPMGTSSWVWHEVQPMLARRGHAVYAWDMLGAAGSSAPDRPGYNISDHARNVVELLDHIGETRVQLVGNSIGGAVATEVAAMYPERIERLVLIGTPAQGPTKLAEGPDAMTKMQLDERGHYRARKIEDQHRTCPYITPEQLVKLNEIRLTWGIWGIRGHEALSRFDGLEHLPRIKCPTLVVYGDADPAVSSKERLMSGIPGAREQTIPKAGHMPQLENPAATFSMLDAFLAPSLVRSGSERSA